MIEPYTTHSPCRYGEMVYPANDMFVGRSLSLYGEFSQGEADAFLRLIKPGSVVLDIGANVGAHTVVFSHAVGLRGQVWAFEPQRIIYTCLCANVALNSLLNVRAENMACGDEKKAIDVPALSPFLPAANWGGVSLLNATQGESVLCMPIDCLPLTRCDFIKVDVEGMEAAVLQGGAATIQKYKPLLYVEVDRDELNQELCATIDALGYTAYYHETLLFNPENYLRNEENVFGNIGSMNVLCVPDGKPCPIEGLPVYFRKEA